MGCILIIVYAISTLGMSLHKIKKKKLTKNIFEVNIWRM
jgi:hypothetical protein